jgi:hypothetical protein
MKAEFSSETLLTFCQSTWLRISEDLEDVL